MTKLVNQLTNVAVWLENGCEPAIAAKELRSICRELAHEPIDKDKFHEREPLNIIMRYKAERTTEVEAAAEIRAYVTECVRRVVTQIQSPSAICALLGCKLHEPHTHGVVE